MIYKHKAHKKVQVLKQQVSEQTAELDKVKMQRAADAEHLTALNGEIDSLKESVICKHKKMRSTQKVQVLKQQVSEQTAELDKVKIQRAADAEHLTALNDEIDSLKGERDLQAQEKEKHTKSSSPKTAGIGTDR